jgi:uncharacterized alkaline shock family protein YloU
LHLIELKDILNFLTETYNLPFYSRISLFLIGILLILFSISFVQSIFGKFQKEKTIAFTTSQGQVTISLSAVEDLIKRLTANIFEIRELRPDVIATKKGLEVYLRVVLRSEANIPDLTMRVQELVRTKIQEILGIEEPISVKIHVAKITYLEEKKKKEEEAEPTIPFTGYGR